MGRAVCQQYENMPHMTTPEECILL